MTEAFLVGPVRSAVGKRGGGLSHVHPQMWAQPWLPEHVPGTTIDRQCGSCEGGGQANVTIIERP